ncbi:unnamed protein product [Linum trigynum]|uniref:Uncharacterized protein n=1 Tax=Linum trigynum TaxID=586398 RepID=A0AAV2EBZ2_9ROSI
MCERGPLLRGALGDPNQCIFAAQMGGEGSALKPSYVCRVIGGSREVPLLQVEPPFVVVEMVDVLVLGCFCVVVWGECLVLGFGGDDDK